MISFGFWPGDRDVWEPTFYSYTAPERLGLTDQPLEPRAAGWLPNGGTATLSYEDVRLSDSPEQTLLGFLRSAYGAGACTVGWDEEALRTRVAPESGSED